MALSETARLIASLELQDKFSPSIKKADQSLSKFQSGLGQTGKGIGQIGTGIGRVTGNLLKFGVAGAAAVGGFLALNLKAGVEQVRLLELATSQTNAVIKSTGGIANVSAGEIRNLAEKYESLNATIDDKVIQSGENLLLTFTNVTDKAFEPALQAILDMNQAMGGGEEGLQRIAIMVGKALQDPIRGATALRRVGVNLSKEQQKQIKLLVEQNNLYGAQQIILKELATEFGGSFAAAGNTAAGRTAKLKDSVEDLQRTFAGPFAEVLDRTTGKLGSFLAEEGTVAAVNRLGSSIAGLFTDEAIDRGIGVLRSGLDLLTDANLARVGSAVRGAFSFVKSLDFETIGKGLEITARVAKTAVDAFLSLPPELQSVAIAALAVNKLGGGVIASGIGNLAAGLLKIGGIGGRGATPANPLFVSQVGGVGGATVAGAGGASLISKVFMTGIAAEAGFLLGSAISNALVDAGVGGIKPARTFEQGALTDAVNSQDVSRIVDGINSIDEQLKPSLTDLGLSLEDSGAAIALALDIGGVRTQLEKDRQVLLDQLTELGLTREEAEKIVAAQERATAKYGETAVRQIGAIESLHLPLGIGNEINRQIRDRSAAAVEQQRNTKAAIDRWGGKLDVIAAKDWSVNVKIPITNVVSISASNVVRTLTSYTAAIGSGPGGALDASLL
jgi:hypothetical protein